MYIDIVPNRNSPPAVLLRESYRENGKVKKRTLANLSQLPKHLVEAIRLMLKGTAVTCLEVISGPIFGVLFVLNALAQQCGIVAALGRSRQARLVLFLILARIAHQGSRLSAVRWARDHAVAQVLGLDRFDEEDLYAALRWASEQQEAIEDRLYQTYCTQRGQVPVLILYDVTSAYLEGSCNALGDYGYNRDGKKGKQQLVIGLLTGDDGEPLTIQVFRGNTADPATFRAQIAKVTERFGITEVIFVGDRGMIKAKGKQALSALGLRYITALTDPQIRKLINDNVLQPDLFDEQVVEVEHAGKRYVLRRDPATYRKEQHRRADKLAQLQQRIDERNTFVAGSARAKAETGLRTLGAWAKRHRLDAFVTLTLEERMIHLIVDEAEQEKAALLDGCYCIESDARHEQLDAQAVHDRYKDLQQVERNFRTLKTGLLEIRPVFVRKEEATRGHAFIAMLSLKVTRLFEQRLHDAFGTTQKNSEAETLPSALDALSRLTLNYYETQDQRVPVLNAPDPRQNRILSALKVKLTPPAQAA